MSSPQPKYKELSYFRKKLLTNSERTVCECVFEHTGNISDDTTWKEAWLCVTSKHRLSEFGELEEVTSNGVTIRCQPRLYTEKNK